MNIYTDFNYIDGNVVTFNLKKNMLDDSYFISEHHGYKHCICWSGGMDSSLLLFELLDKYGSENVIAISMIFPWLLEKKRDNEKNARELFKTKMNSLGSRFANFTHVELTNEYKLLQGPDSWYPQGGGLPQAVSWLQSSSVYIPNNSFIYTGAIREDDLSLRQDPYHQMFEGMMRLLNKQCILREPYIQLRKEEIIVKLIQYGLYDIPWFCEMPNDIGQICFQCHPCRLHMKELYCIANGLTNQDYPDSIKTIANKHLCELNRRKELLSQKSNSNCMEDKEYTYSKSDQ